MIKLFTSHFKGNISGSIGANKVKLYTNPYDMFICSCPKCTEIFDKFDFLDLRGFRKQNIDIAIYSYRKDHSLTVYFGMFETPHKCCI